MTYPTLAEHSRVLLLIFHYATSEFREPFVTKGLVQNFTLFEIKTKCNFAPKYPILHKKMCNAKSRYGSSAVDSEQYRGGIEDVSVRRTFETLAH